MATLKIHNVFKQMRKFQGLHACIQDTNTANLLGDGGEGINSGRIYLIVGCTSFPDNSKLSTTFSQLPLFVQLRLLHGLPSHLRKSARVGSEHTEEKRR